MGRILLRRRGDLSRTAGFLGAPGTFSGDAGCTGVEGGERSIYNVMNVCNIHTFFF
jgi:hypothetical protein